MDDNKLIKLIDDIGFKEESRDRILEYLKNHANFEIIYPIHVDGNSTIITLPYALKVLYELEKDDLLNKIHFVTDITENSIPIITHVSKYQFDNDELFMISDIEMHLMSNVVSDTVLNLKKILKIKEIYIYILFSDIKNIDNVLYIFSRFAINYNK